LYVVSGGEAPERNDRREVLGWAMYDWAQSAFSTTVITVLSGPYLTALAQGAVGDNGVVLSLGPLGSVTAKSFFPFCISLSVLLQVIAVPVLGAAADYTHLKKPLLAAFTAAGALATSLLVFASDGRHLLGGALLVAANVCFGIVVMLTNAYLNDITTQDARDRVSSRGYALGYLGGGLLLLGNLALVTFAGALGVSRGMAVRLSLLSAGLWWGGFGALAIARLRRRSPARKPPEGISPLIAVMRELAGAWRDLFRLPQTLRFLVSYTAYNDAVQTVIAIASVFLAQELFVARGLPADEGFLISLILMVQFVAVGGAILFARLAAVAGAKRAIIVALLGWMGIVVYAYAALQTTTQAWVMGAVIALVLGGSQALSRSLFSRMIPDGHEAAFFGLYEITDRGTSWLGPFVFGVVVGVTGSYRDAILSLVFLFGAGLVGLVLTDTDRAVADARGK
jgi:UMF1 family MFS transporter